MKDSRDGGRGLHRLRSMPVSRRRAWRRGAQHRQADVRCRSQVARADQQAPRAIPSSKPTFAITRRWPLPSSSFRPTAVIHLAAESHVDRSITGLAGLRPNQHRRHAHCCSRRPGAIGSICRSEQRDGFRFLHVSTDEVYGSLGPTGFFQRDHALRPKLALLGIEGRIRPSRAGLAPDLWSAGAHLQLLEQLRALPVSREADPAHDPQRRRGQAAAGLRRRLQRARLALRGRSCARALGDPARAAVRARSTMSAAAASAPICRSSSRFARCWTSAARRGARTAGSSRS